MGVSEMKTEWNERTTMSRGSGRDWRKAIIAATALVLVLGCTGDNTSQRNEKPVSLRDIDTLESAFVGDAGSIRLILLLSPT